MSQVSDLHGARTTEDEPATGNGARDKPRSFACLSLRV